MIPIEQTDDYWWRIPPAAKPGMRVPAIVFADKTLMERIRSALGLMASLEGAWHRKGERT